MHLWERRDTAALCKSPAIYKRVFLTVIPQPRSSPPQFNLFGVTLSPFHLRIQVNKYMNTIKTSVSVISLG